MAVFFLPTRTVSGQVVDSATGQPVPRAVIRMDGQEINVGADGTFSMAGARFGSSVGAGAKGYLPASAIIAMDSSLKLLLAPRVLRGTVTDGQTKKPLQGVKVSAESLSTETDEQGRYRLVGIEPGGRVVATAPGYRGVTLQYDGQETGDLALPVSALNLAVVNQYTGQPVQDADVTDGRSQGRTDQRGQARLQYLLQGAEVTVKQEGFAPAKITYTGQDSADVKLRPDTITGRVKTSAGKPLAKATVTDGKVSATTDDGGAFRLSGVQENARLAVTAAGYERKQMEIGQSTTAEVELKPFTVRGLYLTFYGVGDDTIRNHVLELADKTEINSVVIDIKGDRGWIVYRSNVPMVKEIGAQQDIMISDPKKFLADLKKRGVYTIARIVAFKDNPLATARPDLAVTNANTGRPWVDQEGLRWADPTREEVWNYDVALAVEAVQNGFDEVQFDYVRFPTDASAGNSLDSIRFSKPNTLDNRMGAINGFLEKAKQAIHAAGGAVSADIFGYVVWRDGDMGIGQNLEELAKHLDYVSPMVYPNLFWDGIDMNGVVKYGDRKSGLYPYEIVFESMKIAAKRIGPAKLRPWLQYYNDYITGKGYGAEEMRLQKKAAYDNGIDGWLFWDPTNQFSKGGFEPK